MEPWCYISFFLSFFFHLRALNQTLEHSVQLIAESDWLGSAKVEKVNTACGILKPFYACYCTAPVTEGCPEKSSVLSGPLFLPIFLAPLSFTAPWGCCTEFTSTWPANSTCTVMPVMSQTGKDKLESSNQELSEYGLDFNPNLVHRVVRWAPCDGPHSTGSVQD